MDQIEPSSSRVTVWDAELKGFGVRVEPTGSKVFVIRYRANGGGRGAPERLLTLGRYGTLTVDLARTKAKGLLASVRLGADPATERVRRRTMPTFAAVAERLLDEATEMALARPLEARLRPGTIRNYRSLLSRHLRAQIGSLHLDAITTADLTRIHQTIGREKPATANRCMEFVGSVYRVAAREGLVPPKANPASGVAAFKEIRRERFLKADELARLGDAIREAETIGIEWVVDPAKKVKHLPKVLGRVRIDAGAAAAIRLLILTGARLREILHAKWEDVDLERGILVVHGKAGRRPVVLSGPAKAILSTLPYYGAYIFPGESAGKPRADLNRPWRAVRRRAKLDGVRLHDLRHSFASVAAAEGSSLPIIGKLLGHTQAQTTLRYSHLADDPLRNIAEKVGDAVTAGLIGTTSQGI